MPQHPTHAATPGTPSVLLYLFPERFIPPEFGTLYGHPLQSRIDVPSFRLAVDLLTVAIWGMREQGIVSLQPYAPTRTLTTFRAALEQVRGSLLPFGDHRLRVATPAGRIQVTCYPGTNIGVVGAESLEKGLFQVCRAMHGRKDLRLVVRQWLAGELQRLTTFAIPPASGWFPPRHSTRQADHRVLCAVEDAAIAQGYLTRLPVDAQIDQKWHGKSPFWGAFGRLLVTNPDAVQHLSEAVNSFEDRWRRFQADEPQLHSLIREQCGKELEREGG